MTVNVPIKQTLTFQVLDFGRVLIYFIRTGCIFVPMRTGMVQLYRLKKKM